MCKSTCFFVVLFSVVFSSSLLNAQAQPNLNLPAMLMTVSNPYLKTIYKDQAFDLEGHMVTFLDSNGFFGPGIVRIDGTVEIGRKVEETYVDPLTGKPVNTINYISVREIAVSGQVEVGADFFTGFGVEYKKRVEANPHWIVGETYFCYPINTIPMGVPGSFIVIDQGGGGSGPVIPNEPIIPQ